MKSNKEIAAKIRKQIKDAGIKGVGVRSDEYAIRCTIKSAAVDRRDVEKIARGFEVVDWDERTDEILAGGNTIVLVEYAHGVFDEVAEQLEDEARGILEGMEGRECINISGGLFLEDLNGLEVRQSGEGRRLIGSARDLAVALYKFRAFGSIAA